MSKKYLVTGGAGFVGSNLIEFLSKKTDLKIISLDNYSTGNIKNHIKYTLELFISCLIALEISLEPNPYIKELIFILLIYIALKHNLTNKTLNSIKKYL